MKKVVVLVGLVMLVSLAFAADSWTGYISDAKCKKGGADHAACAKKCIAGGEKAVLVTDDGGKVVQIANQDKVKGHEGHHVTVTGKLDGDNLTIASLKMVKDSK